MKIKKNTALRRAIARDIAEFIARPTQFTNGILHGRIGAAMLLGMVSVNQYSRILNNVQTYEN